VIGEKVIGGWQKGEKGKGCRIINPGIIFEGLQMLYGGNPSLLKNQAANIGSRPDIGIHF
jgi:hypothetical protein